MKLTHLRGVKKYWVLISLFFKETKLPMRELEFFGVIDGNTLVLAGKVRIRLRSLDAPELINCGGPKAKKELEKWVLSKKVEIKEKVIDQQGRPMVFVYTDNVFVNLKMLESG